MPHPLPQHNEKSQNPLEGGLIIVSKSLLLIGDYGNPGASTLHAMGPI